VAVILWTPSGHPPPLSRMPASPVDHASRPVPAPTAALDQVAPGPPRGRGPSPGLVGVVAELSKARLSALVVATTAAGFVVAEPVTIDWARLGWTVVGTALAAASASMLNQLAEVARDGLMHRTKDRPLPAGRIGRIPVFVGGVILAYAGVSVLAQFANILAAGLALANLLLYVLVYTPLKPRTSLNTLVGAVTGAIPPMIGWASAGGTLPVAAWLLGGILFVWQLPHFLALAWIYREDYDRGGFRMLPGVDRDGVMTSMVVLAGSLLLVPLGLLGVRLGLAGWWYGVGSLLLGGWMSALSLSLWRRRGVAEARRVFLASLAYLPVLLVLMVVDRGPVSMQAWIDGGRPAPVVISEAPVTPEAPTPRDATPRTEP